MLARDPAPRLRDLARSVCAAGRGPVWVAIVADSIDDLRAKLDGAKAGTPDRRGVYVAGLPGDAGKRGPVAFLCPGQGSQRPGMLAELFITFPRLHRLLALGEKWARTMFPPAPFTREERAAQAAALTDTRVAQPALGIADLAVADLLARSASAPTWRAATATASWPRCASPARSASPTCSPCPRRAASTSSTRRARIPARWSAVAASADVVAPVVAGCEGVVIANHNSPSQCVLSGPTRRSRWRWCWSAAGLTARRLPVACAFHSPVVAAARDGLARRLAEMDLAAPRIPVWSNVTAEPYPADADGVRALIADQVAKPVKFAQEIEAMYAAGARIFVETGPGQVLTRLVAEILGDRPHVAVATDAGGDPGVRQLLKAVATLAVHGVAVDASVCSGTATPRSSISIPNAPRSSAMQWVVNGHVARPAGTEVPRSSHVVPALGSAAATALALAPSAIVPAGGNGVHAVAPGFPVSERDGVVVEYLRTMRQMIGAQRDVMLQYLGAPAGATAVYVPHEAVAMPVHAIEVAPAAVAAPVVAAPAAPPSTLQLAITIVSERTGYPVETLGLDLDLEADLSIDSIKRIEIIGELAARLGLRVQDGGADSDAVVEELATRKTLRGLVEWLDNKVGTAVAAPATDTASAEAAPRSSRASARRRRARVEGAPRSTASSSISSPRPRPATAHRPPRSPASASASSAVARSPARSPPGSRTRARTSASPSAAIRWSTATPSTR